MPFAVIETGGKQYTVAPNEAINIEKLSGESGDKVSFDKVLMFADEDDVKLGKPYLDGVQVTGSIQQQGKDKKIRVFKYKSKTRQRKTKGHRQPFTTVKIDEIKT